MLTRYVILTCVIPHSPPLLRGRLLISMHGQPEMQETKRMSVGFVSHQSGFKIETELIEFFYKNK